VQRNTCSQHNQQDAPVISNYLFL